jgi:hypothetical protein
MKLSLIALMTFVFAPTLAISSIASAQSPAEREAQRLVPRTPGSWPAFTTTQYPEKLNRPVTYQRSPVSNPLESAYCKYTRLFSQPADGYLQYYSIYETCVEPTLHDNPPLAMSVLAFEDLCRNAAFIHNPVVPPGMVQARLIFGCTLEKFTDTEIQISVREAYNYNNPNGACYNDPMAICGQTISSNVRTTCSLVAQEPVPQWQCFLDGTTQQATNDRRTESLPNFDNPVPTDPASRESLLKLIEQHIKARL